MDQISREDRKHLTELVRLFEHPAEAASRYRRFSYLSFSFAFLLVFTAGFSRLLKIDHWEGAILLVAGTVIGFGIFYRSAARQIPLWIKYAELKTEEAKAALLPK